MYPGMSYMQALLLKVHYYLVSRPAWQTGYPPMLTIKNQILKT